MKKFVFLVVMTAGMSFNFGCSTPLYSTQDRFQRIGRNWGFEYEQINDDIDHLFLLRPATHLSESNLQ